MIEYELKTQMFYLNRIFEILSDGYMIAVVSFHSTIIQGVPNIPFTQIDDKYKRDVLQSELKTILDFLFNELYKHSKQFSLAPILFNQNWNNECILKSITEAKNCILGYVRSNERIIKTSNDIIKDHFQVIEFVDESNGIKEVLFFQTWFH